MIAVPAPVFSPGSVATRNERTSTGDARRSPGYSRSSSLMLATGTGESISRTPVAVRGDLPPADPIGQVAVLEGDLRRPSSAASAVNPQRQPQGGQTARAGPRLERASGRPPVDRPAVHGEDERGGDVGTLGGGRGGELAGGRGAVRRDRLQCLGRRDLGPVDDCRELDPVGKELDVGVVVDREVPERMGLGRPRARRAPGAPAPRPTASSRRPLTAGRRARRAAPRPGGRAAARSRDWCPAPGHVARALSACPTAASITPRW